MRPLTRVSRIPEILRIEYNINFASNERIYNLILARNLERCYLYSDLDIEKAKLYYRAEILRDKYNRLFEHLKKELVTDDITIESIHKEGTTEDARTGTSNTVGSSENTIGTDTRSNTVPYDMATESEVASEQVNRDASGNTSSNTNTSDEASGSFSNDETRTLKKTAGALDRILQALEISGRNILEEYIKEFDKLFFYET